MDNKVMRGDIFYIEKSASAYATGSEQYAGRPGIIVSNEKNNACSETVEIVYLTAQPKTDLPTHVVIRSARKPSVAICEQINTVSKSRLGDYVGACTDNEMFQIDIALGISLGLSDLPQPEERSADPEETYEPEPEPEDTPDEPEAESDAGADVSTLMIEQARLQAERDTYKELYERLLRAVAHTVRWEV